MATAEYRLSSKPTVMLRTSPARTPTRSPSRGNSTWSTSSLCVVSAGLSRRGGRARAGGRLHGVRDIGLRREDHPVELRLAPDEQAAQQADLTRDQLGRPQAERVEPEDRRPVGRSRLDDEAVRIAADDAEAVALTPDVGRLERGQASVSVEVDGLEPPADRQPGRRRAA